MNQQPETRGKRRQHYDLYLIVTALMALALGIYQWLELIAIRSGGTTPLCSISSTIDCAPVWNSPLANAVHELTGIPFAGWGIAWAAIVLLLTVEFALQTRKGQTGGDAALALRVTAASGVTVCLILLAYSLFIKVICPTCFIFYLLVGIAAFLTFRLSKGSSGKWSSALMQTIGLLLISFALLSYPGRQIPQAGPDLSSLKAFDENTQPGEDPLAKFLMSLTEDDQQLVSDSRAMYQATPLIDRPVDKNRLISGTTLSPVHIIDWIEIRCPHCRHLDEALTEIRASTPANSWSEEGRHFPLDRECNPNVRRSDNSHISCLAAKVLICLGGSPKGNQVRSTLFENQRELSVDKIWEIAAPEETERAPLQTCVDSPDTAATLDEDIDFAMQHHIEGTPLLVINGKQAPAFPPFIYAMIVAGGDSNAAGFRVLPPPRDKLPEH